MIDLREYTLGPFLMAASTVLRTNQLIRSSATQLAFTTYL
jgi:hypothetical protein